MDRGWVSHLSFLEGGGGGKRAPVDRWASGKFDNKLFQNQGRTIQNQNSNLTDENIRGSISMGGTMDTEKMGMAAGVS